MVLDAYGVNIYDRQAPIVERLVSYPSTRIDVALLHTFCVSLRDVEWTCRRETNYGWNHRLRHHSWPRHCGLFALGRLEDALFD